jgi:hypothetical protein
MNYTELEEKIRTHLIIPEDDADFGAMMPDFANFGELRIYRDMPELLGENEEVAANFTINNREIAVPVSMFLVKGLAFVSAGATTPLQNVSKEFIDMIWPTRATTGTLQYWANLDDDKLIVAGTPTTAFGAVFTGLVREDPLGEGNPETYLSVTYPDLLFSSCMIYATGYQRDYGQQADDPKMAVSWESMYNKLLPGVIAQEERKSSRGPGWTAHAPTPLATPPRE